MEEIERAIAALKSGEPVVFATDTVYGIGVAVRYAPSPQAIYDIKCRDADKPVAWLVGGVEALDEYGIGVSTEARALAKQLWPGALTLIVKASGSVPEEFRAQTGTIGMRMPACDTALALIREVGPIATSSANLSGGPDPRDFSDLDPELLAAVPVALQSDEPASGTASTVLDCTHDVPVVVRSGSPRPAGLYQEPSGHDKGTVPLPHSCRTTVSDCMISART